MINGVTHNLLGTSSAYSFGLGTPWMAPLPADDKRFMRSSDNDQPRPETLGPRHAEDDMELMYFRYQTVSPVGVEYISDALARALGYTTRSFLDDRMLLVRLTIDADRKRLASFLSSASTTRPSSDVSWRSQSGRILHMRLTGRTVQTEDGHVVAMDVTARPLAPADSTNRVHQRFVQQLDDALAYVDVDLEAQFNHLADAVMELGADFVVIVCEPGKNSPSVTASRWRAAYPEVGAKLERFIARWQTRALAEIDDPLGSTGQQSTLVQNAGVEIDWDRVRVRIPNTLIERISVEGSNRPVGLVLFGTAPNNSSMTLESLRLCRLFVRSTVHKIEGDLLREEARELSRGRERFLSTMAHELKTPITSIRGYVQLLGRYLGREAPDLPRSRRAVDGLETQINRFIALSEDLLDAARIAQNSVKLRLTKVNLGELAQLVSDRVGQVESFNDSRLKVENASDVVGTWDLARVDQLIEILLSNALRYSGDSGVLVKVESDRREAVLSVSDQGIGIDARDLERIFEPFERGRIAASITPGSGLGLYRAREIVRHHAGTMEIQSRVNEGTTVTVRLPIEYSSAQP